MGRKPLPQLRDHTQVPFEQWKGLYSRGKIDDVVPKDFFTDCLNVKTYDKELGTRAGYDLDLSLNNIRRLFIYKRLNETSRYIVLDTSGNLFDSLYPGTPIITNVVNLDFSAVTFLNRCYIMFHNRITGISGSVLYIYNGGGPGDIRPAAGAAPVGFTISIADSLNSGFIEAGIHLFAWAYETDSGFITAPGPAAFAAYTAPGGFKAVINNVPIGPAGTSARRLLATKVIPDYDGNQYGTEFFFVPNGRIADNSTTTLEFDFFDDDLLDSADYLFDNLSSIAAGLGMYIYNNRAVIWGIPGLEHYALISTAGQIEVFDETAGVIFLDPSDSTTGIQNVIEFAKNLILFTGDKCKVTTDNDSDPDTWSVDTLDDSIGTGVFGISKIYNSRGVNTSRFFVADKSGLYLYEQGRFQKPEISWNIENVWKRINKAQFSKVQVEHNPESCLIYVSVPLDSSTECNYLLVADYSKAFGNFGQIVAADVRWFLWQFPWNITSIAVDIDTNQNPSFKLSGTNNIYVENHTDTYLDAGTKITSLVESFHAYLNQGYIHHFGYISLRATGQGQLAVVLRGMDNVKSVTPPVFTLATAPGQYYEKPVNLVNPKATVKLTCSDNAGDYFILLSMSLDIKALWAEHPHV